MHNWYLSRVINPLAEWLQKLFGVDRIALVAYSERLVAATMLFIGVVVSMLSLLFPHFVGGNGGTGVIAGCVMLLFAIHRFWCARRILQLAHTPFPGPDTSYVMSHLIRWRNHDWLMMPVYALGTSVSFLLGLPFLLELIGGNVLGSTIVLLDAAFHMLFFLGPAVIAGLWQTDALTRLYPRLSDPLY